MFKATLYRYNSKILGQLRKKVRRCSFIRVNLPDGCEIELEVTKMGLCITSHGGHLQFHPVSAGIAIIDRSTLEQWQKKMALGKKKEK